MAKKNNLIEEIQELIQQIKNEYQEGIDFKAYDSKGNFKLSRKIIWWEIISPQLKKHCREKFSLPLSDNNHHLDFWQDGTNYYFVFKAVKGEPDSLFFVENGAKQEQKNETENCKRCNQLVAKKEGWIQQWDGRKVGDEPDPNIIAYFHPDCAKKYFADREQPNQNEISRLKEKLLRNLDKISLDSLGDLANAELLKDKEIESKYYWKPNYKSSEHKKIAAQIYKVEIEGEKIDLEKLFFIGSEGYLELKRAIIQEIKQNPQEWEINFSPEGVNLQYVKWMVQHQSGRRHWSGSKRQDFTNST